MTTVTEKLPHLSSVSITSQSLSEKAMLNIRCYMIVQGGERCLGSLKNSSGHQCAVRWHPTHRKTQEEEQCQETPSESCPLEENGCLSQVSSPLCLALTELTVHSVSLMPSPASTGGSAGIGAATALQFDANGAVVAVLGRRLERLESVVKQLKSGHAIVGDLTRASLAHFWDACY